MKGVLNQINDLIHKIHTEQHQHHHYKIDEALPLCIIQGSDGDRQRSMCDLNGDFLHSQLLIDCSVKMKNMT